MTRNNVHQSLFKQKPFTGGVFPTHHSYTKPVYQQVNHQQSIVGHINKPLYSTQTNLNPTKSTHTGILLRKKQDHIEKNNNIDFMQQGKVHIGKSCIYLIADKLIYGSEPTVNQALKELLVNFVMDTEPFQVVKNEASKLGIENEDVLQVVTNVLLNSLIEMRLPESRDFVLAAIPEIIEKSVNTRTVGRISNQLERKILGRSDMAF